MLPLPTLARTARPSIVRVIVHPRKGDIDVGTGFVFHDDGSVLTCAHMLFRTGQVGEVLGKRKGKQRCEAFLRSYFERTVESVEIERADGTRVRVEDVRFDGAMDICVLRTTKKTGPALKMAAKPADIGEDLFLCGFPHAVQTDLDRFPYAAWKGTVMGSGEFRVGGYDKRAFMFINAWSLWGASGSPVFSTQGRVVGMLTGQMTWGSDQFAFVERGQKNKRKIVRDTLYVPLPYGFMTPIDVVLRTARQLIDDPRSYILLTPSAPGSP
jgi:S1-C subfamily serine protease